MKDVIKNKIIKYQIQHTPEKGKKYIGSNIGILIIYPHDLWNNEN